jgi:hypothetical protein
MASIAIEIITEATPSTVWDAIRDGTQGGLSNTAIFL